MVKFRCKGVKNQGLVELSSGLKELHALTFLQLGFAFCRMDDEVLKSLSQSLESLKSLQNLNLYMNGWKDLSDEGFKFLCERIEKLPGLIGLLLNLSQ